LHPLGTCQAAEGLAQQMQAQVSIVLKRTEDVGKVRGLGMRVETVTKLLPSRYRGRSRVSQSSACVRVVNAPHTLPTGTKT